MGEGRGVERMGLTGEYNNKNERGAYEFIMAVYLHQIQ